MREIFVHQQGHRHAGCKTRLLFSFTQGKHVLRMLPRVNLWRGRQGQWERRGKSCSGDGGPHGTCRRKEPQNLIMKQGIAADHNTSGQGALAPKCPTWPKKGQHSSRKLVVVSGACHLTFRLCDKGFHNSRKVEM